MPSLSEGGRCVHGVHSGGTQEGLAYRWIQSLNELGLSWRAPAGVRARELTCSFSVGRVTLARKGGSGSVLVSFQPLGPIVPDGCSWTLEGGTCVQVVLEKKAKGRFWRCLSEGHTEVAMPGWWPHVV